MWRCLFVTLPFCRIINVNLLIEKNLKCQLQHPVDFGFCTHSAFCINLSVNSEVINRHGTRDDDLETIFPPLLLLVMAKNLHRRSTYINCKPALNQYIHNGEPHWRMCAATTSSSFFSGNSSNSAISIKGKGLANVN